MSKEQREGQLNELFIKREKDENVEKDLKLENVEKVNSSDSYSEERRIIERILFKRIII